MKWKTKDDIYNKVTEEYDKVKYRCKCGHRVVIPAWVDKQVCSWCGSYVYKNKEDEFKDRMKSVLRSVE